LTIEARLAAIEDRLALQEVVNAYCTAVDKLADVEGLVSLFTEDAVIDMSAIHLPHVRGHAGIRGFFEPVFAMMSHHAHYWSNFRVERLAGDEASITAYVIGLGHAKDGNSVKVYVQYFMDCVRTARGWKIKHYRIKPRMPLPASLTEIHGER
jgi:ketosteroid isomerase-like protein